MILLISVFLVQSVSGQSAQKYFFNEVSASLNRTLVEDDNTQDRFGMGLGIYHSILPAKGVLIKFGIEYNRTSQFKKFMSGGHYYHSKDVTYSMNNLSIPVTAGIIFGKNTKFFIEPGFFVDLNMGTSMRGIMYTFLPRQNPTENKFNKKADFANLNLGPSFGLGFKVPISKYELTLKTEYKLGMRVLNSAYEQITNRYFRMMIGLKI